MVHIRDHNYVRVQKFCTFDCYDILPALKQEVQFDAHEFHYLGQSWMFDAVSFNKLLRAAFSGTRDSFNPPVLCIV